MAGDRSRWLEQPLTPDGVRAGYLDVLRTIFIKVLVLGRDLTGREATVKHHTKEASIDTGTGIGMALTGVSRHATRVQDARQTSTSRPDVV